MVQAWLTPPTSAPPLKMAVPVRRSRKAQAKVEQWLPRGAPGRYRSRGVVRMPGGVGPDEEEGGEVVSEAQKQLRVLLNKQLNTSAGTVERSLERSPMFQPAVTFKPQAGQVVPLRTLHQYCQDEEELGKQNELRGAGLSEQEMQLVLEGEREGGVQAEPSAVQERRRVIQEKLSSHVASLAAPVSYSGVREMSRHAFEVEQSLFRGTEGNPLSHLTVLARKSDVAVYPARCEMSSHLAGDKVEEEEEEEEEEGSATHALRDGGRGEVKEAAAAIPALPLEVIQRNRLTTEQIQRLPRFRHYSPGAPSQVLYIKNLHPKVSLDDLNAIFGHFQEGVWPKLRLMTGRMWGQAFAEFSSEAKAAEALAVVNGYVVRDKALVISYGHQRTHSPVPPPHPQAQSPHTQAQSPHTQAQSPHPQAQSPHTQAQSPHPQAQSPHTQAHSSHSHPLKSP